MQKYVPQFELHVLAAAWQTDQPMHSQSAKTEHIKTEFTQLSSFTHARPCILHIMALLPECVSLYLNMAGFLVYSPPNPQIFSHILTELFWQKLRLSLAPSLSPISRDPRSSVYLTE